MSLNVKRLFGAKLAALDGAIGEVTDFYFDDKTWIVRYVVAETGSWFQGQKVLLSPYAFGPLTEDGDSLRVNLTKDQIAASPLMDTQEPVSRQYEVKYYRHYGWPAYWEGRWTWGTSRYPILLPLAVGAGSHEYDQIHNHLRSLRAVDGYRVATPDGTVGHVSGLGVDRDSWEISEVIVKTGHHSGDEILLSPSQVDEISFPERLVLVNLSRPGQPETAPASGGTPKALPAVDLGVGR
jgi:hypothetical protein